MIAAYLLTGFGEVAFIDFFAIEKSGDSNAEILDMVEAVDIEGVGGKHKNIQIYDLTQKPNDRNKILMLLPLTGQNIIQIFQKLLLANQPFQTIAIG